MVPMTFIIRNTHFDIVALPSASIAPEASLLLTIYLDTSRTDRAWYAEIFMPSA